MRYGGWAVPPSTVCKPETPESWLCNSVQLWRSENQECQEQEKTDVLAEAIRQEGVNSSFSACHSIQAFNGLGDTHPHRGEGKLLYWAHWFKGESHPETSS